MFLLPVITAVGLHIGSYHDKPGFNNTNPGIYLVSEDNTVVGIYNNSFKKPSLYVVKNFSTEDKRFSLAIGAVTGYSQSPVMPLIVPSIKLGNFRLSFLPRSAPKNADVLHLSYEILLP